MDMNNFNLLKNEFANLTNQLKSSLESANSLGVLNELELGSTATTLTNTATANSISSVDFSKLNSTASLVESKSSDSTNTLLNSINNLKLVAGCVNPTAMLNENAEQTWVNKKIKY